MTTTTTAPPSRLPEAAAVLLLVGALGAFVAALLQSKPPAPPSIAVQGEPLLPEGAPVALRFSAAMPKGTAHAELIGEVHRVGTSTQAGASAAVAIENGTALLAGGPGDFEADVEVVDDSVKDAPPTRVHARVHFHSERARMKPSAKLVFQPWEGDVVIGPRGGTPVYAVDGQASTRLPSKVIAFRDPHVTLDDGEAAAAPAADVDAIDVLDIAPDMQGARVGKRVLRADRSGLRIEAPLQVDACKSGTCSVDVTVLSAEKRAVGVDLLCAGVVVDSQNLDVDGSAVVQLRLPSTACKPGDVAVATVGGVWPDDVARYAVFRITDPAQPLLPWFEAQAGPAGASLSEPLIAYLEKKPEDAVAARALLQRMWPAKMRAPKLTATVTTTSSNARLYIEAYAALAAAAVLLVFVLGFVRVKGRRLQAALATLVLAGILAGLGAVLVVTG